MEYILGVKIVITVTVWSWDQDAVNFGNQQHVSIRVSKPYLCKTLYPLSTVAPSKSLAWLTGQGVPQPPWQWGQLKKYCTALPFFFYKVHVWTEKIATIDPHPIRHDAIPQHLHHIGFKGRHLAVPGKLKRKKNSLVKLLIAD